MASYARPLHKSRGRAMCFVPVRTDVDHSPSPHTASHPPKQQPLHVQGSKIGPSCCAFSVLSCLQSEGKIMVMMPTFLLRGPAPHPAGAAGLPPWTHNFCTFASCPRPPSLLQCWEHFCKNTLKTPSTSAYFPPRPGESIHTHSHTTVSVTTHETTRRPTSAQWHHPHACVTHPRHVSAY